MNVRRAEAADLDAITALALELWPDHEWDELWQEMADLMAKPETAFFLLEEHNQPMGFAQCQLRHDYVEGTETSPVGYLEGILVRAAMRGKGGAKALLKACESWSAAWGCTEFASDCELDNVGSLAFHLKMGFEEASRNIHFAKKI